MEFDNDTPRIVADQFRDEFTSLTLCRNRNLLRHIIKRRDIKGYIPDSESAYLEVSGAMVSRPRS